MFVRKRIKEHKEIKKGVRPGVDSAIRNLKIWVLYPWLETEDPNLQYYYDFSQSKDEYTKVFNELGADWQWQAVTMQNYSDLIAGLKRASGRKIPLVINLCDGDEINGVPGVSVIRELEKHNLIYTGADAHFYEITTSKIPMKQAFDEAGVSNAKWDIIDANAESFKGYCERLGAPLIIKPAISGGSMGVSVKNVVYTDTELERRVKEIRNGYRGWDLMAGGLMVEQFISGQEFTSFIIGSHTKPASCFVYTPVERIFHPSLPEEEKFLSFDRLWEIYEDEKPMPGNDNFYDYHLPGPDLVPALKDISLAAYNAVGGMGYGRLDIRQDRQTGKLYVLEVNAQCGLSEDENYTSIGAILRYSKKTFTDLVQRIMRDAIRRRKLNIEI